MDNIYANAGNVISGERYVKRKEIENAIKERVLNNSTAGSFSLVGMQRTGKSSILHNMFLSKEKREEFLKEKKIVIDVSLGTIGNAEEIFLNMVRRSYRVIKKREDEDDIEDLTDAYNDALEWSLEDGSLYEILVYLEEMAALDYYLIVIMDEFDNALTLFKDATQCFNFLREIAYKSQYHTNYIIASRRMLSEICSIATKGVSPFPNIFVNGFVGPFNPKEREDYFRIFRKVYRKDIPADAKAALLKHTGGLAFWMDILMKSYVEHMSKGEVNPSIDKIQEEIEVQFWGLYDKLKDLLEDQQLLKPLMQFEFGPIENATRAERSILCSYGIVNVVYEIDKRGKEIEDYEIFAQGFRDYLAMFQNSIEFAPCWNKTERAMRRILQRRLRERDGLKWESKFCDKYANDSQLKLKEAESRLGMTKRNMRNMNVTGDVTIIDMLETTPLFHAISKEWDLLSRVFVGFDLTKWDSLRKSVAARRNDYQHNNYHFLSETVMAQNKANMISILECIEKWEEKHPMK